MADIAFNCGQEVNFVPDIDRLIAQATSKNFNFVVVPLASPRYKRDFRGIVPRDLPWTRSDLLLNSQTWTTLVVGKISTWMNYESTDENVRRNSELAFKQEVAWATHLGLPAILLPTPAYDCANLARCVNQCLSGLTYTQIWVRVPTSAYAPPKLVTDTASSVDGSVASDPWEAWNRLRTMCEYAPNLSIALEVTGDLPDDATLRRFHGEPVKAIILPVSLFVTNKAGCPCLTRRHQKFVIAMFRFTKIQWVLSGKPRHPEGLSAYKLYLHHLWSVKRDANVSGEKFEQPYLDYLQAPLQPLMDNLESSTYETFEQDPVKYVQYEEAVYQALMDLHPNATPEKRPVLMVVGAGRGPLVKASLRASVRACKPLRVFAVEKNPNAVVTLRHMKQTLGWDNVTIVSSDMRLWSAPEKADILVSELLGSFSDNELSPECLDGAQKFLKSDGISIPCWYASYLAPMSSSKLWQDVKSYNDLKHFETGYVVKLHSVNQLAESKETFVFEHPNWSKDIDNNRYKELTFTLQQAATVHGFAGFFDAKLYKDVHISINPANFSTGMFSWFPLYWPIRTPIYVPEGETMTVQFWRNVTSSKVWYEWGVTTPIASPIHNVNGRSYWIGL